MASDYSATPATMAEYYARRASEYEAVYGKPERQQDLRYLADFLSGAFAGQDVLEVACGTGYWTQFIAKSAKSIVATDISAEMLEIARQKDCGACRVSFLQADAYRLAGVPSGRTAGFHGFWWSHIPVQGIPAFLACFHGRLPEGAPIIAIDNSYVEGSSTPVSRTDEHGNSYQIRRLKDGSKHEVLKNFPSLAEIRYHLHDHTSGLQLTQLTHYWIAEYKALQCRRSWPMALDLEGDA